VNNAAWPTPKEMQAQLGLGINLGTEALNLHKTFNDLVLIHRQ